MAKFLDEARFWSLQVGWWLKHVGTWDTCDTCFEVFFHLESAPKIGSKKLGFARLGGSAEPIGRKATFRGCGKNCAASGASPPESLAISERGKVLLALLLQSCISC